VVLLVGKFFGAMQNVRLASITNDSKIPIRKAKVKGRWSALMIGSAEPVSKN
jgi:hypothetical protein